MGASSLSLDSSSSSSLFDVNWYSTQRDYHHLCYPSPLSSALRIAFSAFSSARFCCTTTSLFLLFILIPDSAPSVTGYRLQVTGCNGLLCFLYPHLYLHPRLPPRPRLPIHDPIHLAKTYITHILRIISPSNTNIYLRLFISISTRICSIPV
ncbi:hypothetical protein FIBSPDRAFT_270759 [Athelia psychrophila]|uniref:Uncharacterized protein n=1 Tax=Athelia psychrophila TaxID=1759441 RepID=A0A165WY95_9AGAM|nr:hypothetical protein FIBSPDRAFT_270759 [Fibularhizoctonia sp. CBS 109695]